MKRYRVIAWGTGAVGAEMITAVLDHRSAFDLVGTRVYSADKDSADVGVLAGRDPIGLAATTDVDRILALDADCVLYTPRNTDIDEVCAILASGKNVATTAFLFHPRRTRDADRERLLDACRTGNSTVHGSGLNPGNLSGVLPLTLSGMSRTIDKITLQERADWSFYDSTSITFDNMAFGEPVETISATGTDFLAFNSAIFCEQVWLIARCAQRRHRAGDRHGRCRPGRVRPRDLRSCPARGNHWGPTVDLVGPAQRRDLGGDRDPVDGR
jgi:hypothetical protein